jgi:hypothetical protein
MTIELSKASSLIPDIQELVSVGLVFGHHVRKQFDVYLPKYRYRYTVTKLHCKGETVQSESKLEDPEPRVIDLKQNQI